MYFHYNPNWIITDYININKGCTQKFLRAIRMHHRVSNINRACSSFVNAENELLKLLVTHGPVAAAVNAMSWQNYLGGIIQYHCDGSPNNLNHAVQIVGYDKEARIPHYIIKNSWGSAFGNKGYIYIAIDKNLCGKINYETGSTSVKFVLIKSTTSADNKFCVRRYS